MSFFYSPLEQPLHRASAFLSPPVWVGEGGGGGGVSGGGGGRSSCCRLPDLRLRKARGGAGGTGVGVGRKGVGVSGRRGGGRVQRTSLILLAAMQVGRGAKVRGAKGEEQGGGRARGAAVIAGAVSHGRGGGGRGLLTVDVLCSSSLLERRCQGLERLRSSGSRSGSELESELADFGEDDGKKR